MSIELVMPSSHLILYHPLLLLPSIPPSIRVFSSESTLCTRWPKYWSFSLSISTSNEHPGVISFRMDWLDLLAVQGTLKSLQHHNTNKWGHASVKSQPFSHECSQPFKAFIQVWLSSGIQAVSGIRGSELTVRNSVSWYVFLWENGARTEAAINSQIQLARKLFFKSASIVMFNSPSPWWLGIYSKSSQPVEFSPVMSHIPWWFYVTRCIILRNRKNVSLCVYMCTFVLCLCAWPWVCVCMCVCLPIVSICISW